MTDNDTFDIAADILAHDFHMARDEIRPDRALADLQLDSLALMEFVFAVEDRFQIRIPQERLDPREAGLTLGQLSEIVDEIRSPATADSAARVA
jgi:acyl carrier protein